MIYSTPFKTDTHKKEISFCDPENYPYICFYREMDDFIDRSISWHWHSALEIDYVTEGSVEYFTTEGAVTVEKGELIFINANILHMVAAKEKMPGCKVYAHLFDVTFLAGSYNSLLGQKYILPVIKNNSISMIKISPDSYQTVEMARRFLKTVELNREEPFGYEFMIREQLSGFWLLLLQETEQRNPIQTEKKPADDGRIKLMLNYIHEKYSQHISLEDIAASANISTRECTRCFQRSIRISPVSYLNRYRIHMAADMLINTADSILTVSENCGFSSNSYFGRLFHQLMGCTPAQFRRK